MGVGGMCHMLGDMLNLRMYVEVEALKEYAEQAGCILKGKLISDDQP